MPDSDTRDDATPANDGPQAATAVDRGDRTELTDGSREGPTEADYARVQAAAFAAQAAGLSVLPPTGPGSRADPKSPLNEHFPGHAYGWKHRMEFRATHTEVAAWFAGPRPGLGFVCGRISGGRDDLSMAVLDFDAPEAYRDYRALALSCGLGGLLARAEDGYSEATPKGGRHVYLRVVDGGEIIENGKLARRPIVNADGRPGAETLIEVKAEGGYIVAAPTLATVHPSGRPYVPLDGGPATILEVTREEWEALCDLGRALDEMPIPTAPQVARPARPRKPGDGVLPGERFAAETAWAEILGPAGWDRVGQVGEKGLWRRPGKGYGVSATTHHSDADTFYPFSDNAWPFEARKSYTKFHAYAVLEHGGSDSEAAKALGKQYREADGGGAPGKPAPPRGQGPGGEPPSGDAGPGTAGEPPEDEQPRDRWPVLDERALYGLAGDIVRAIDPHTEAARVAVLVQLVVGIGNLIGRSAHFRVGSTKHFTNTYAMIVGPTAMGRKGTSWEAARSVLEPIDRAWCETRVEGGLVSGEGLINHVRDEVIGKDKQGMDFVSDEGVRDKRFMAIETEMSRVLKAMNRDHNTLSDVIRQAWDTGNLRTLAKNTPVRATGAHVSFVGHTTISDIKSNLTENDSANGFANRYLWICARFSKLLPSGGDFEQIDFPSLLERLRTAVDVGRGAGLIVRDARAAEIWNGVYARLNLGEPTWIGQVLSRGPAQVMRLACIYALLDGRTVIAAEHLNAALALWEYSVASAKFIFGKGGAPTDDEKLLAALRAAPEGLTRTQISIDVFAKNKSAKELKEILEGLMVKLFIGVRKEQSQGGRPAERWFAVTC